MTRWQADRPEPTDAELAAEAAWLREQLIPFELDQEDHDRKKNHEHR